MTTRTLLAAAVAAWSLAAAAGARAAEVRWPHLPLDGPALAGGAVVWGDETRDRGFAVRSAPIAGGLPDVLGTFRPASAAHTVVPAVAASPSRVAVEVFSYAQAPPRGTAYGETVRTFQGRIGGRLRQLHPDCNTRFPGGVPHRSTAVLEDMVASAGTSCTGLATRGAVVTRFDVDPPATTALPATALKLRLAGRLVAYERDGQTFVVRDRDSGGDVYEVAQPSLGLGTTRDTASVDLQPDGKLAYTLYRGREIAVAWSSPQEPYAHVLPLAPAAYAAVKWAAEDQLLVLRARTAVADVVSDGVLELRDVSGRLLRTVARGAIARTGRELFDTDGRRAVYVTRRCNGVRFHVVALDAPTAIAPTVRRCRLRLRTPLRYERTRLRGRLLRTTIDCAGFDTLCTVRRGVATARVHGRRRVIGRAGFGDMAGRGLEIRLNATGRRLLQRRRHPRVRLALTVGDISSYGAPNPLGEQRRVGTFRVRR